MTPVRFLRAMLCLEGGAARARLPRPAALRRARLPPAVLRKPRPPGRLLAGRRDRRHRQGHRAARARPNAPAPRCRAAHKPMWVTELNWESAPQAPHGVPPRLQALWISRALHRLWVAGVAPGRLAVPGRPLPRPAARDLRPAASSRSAARRPLQRRCRWRLPALARPKPFLRGFTFPFDPLRVDRAARARLGAADAPGPAGPAATPTERGGAWRTIARLRADRDGVLNTLLSPSRCVTLRLVGAALLSASAPVPRDRSRL